MHHHTTPSVQLEAGLPAKNLCFKGEILYTTANSIEINKICIGKNKLVADPSMYTCMHAQDIGPTCIYAYMHTRMDMMCTDN